MLQVETTGKLNSLSLKYNQSSKASTQREFIE